MQILHAGPLRVVYEKGFLRRVAYGETEVLRMIYFALRDHNWNTITGELANEVITTGEDSFQIAYDYFNRDDGQAVMDWSASINGHADGKIVFEITGTVRKDFRKNRAGFCVLHPLSVVDQDCTLHHPDKPQSTLPFPREVAPHNPFKQIQSMSWKSDGLPFVLEFEGDIFETEDQRNWGDASFKTFCTPLDNPFPVAMKAGDKVFQRITFRPLATLSAIASATDQVVLTSSQTTHKLPVIGIGASTEMAAFPDDTAESLRALRLHHYRIDLHPADSNWVSDFSKAYEGAYHINLPLEVALHLTDNFAEELEAFVVLCQQNKVKLRKVLLLQTGAMATGQAIIDYIPQLRMQLPSTQFGAGTNYNFNELNKHRFQGTHADYISFAMDPQEHASDDLTILENSASPEYLVKSASALYGEEKQIHLSPLTLRRRFNPYASNPADLFIDESQKADPRQKEPLAAAWTFACLCSLAKGNATAVTLFQTVGNQGILSSDGQPYPVYDVIRQFTRFQKRSVKILDSSDSLKAQGVLLDDKTLGVVNLTSVEQNVRWNGADITLQPWETRFVASDRTEQA